MKKREWILFMVFVLAGMGHGARAATLIKDSRAIARIYHSPVSREPQWPGTKELRNLDIPEMDALALAMAIADLNYHFKEMSGTELEVVVTEDPKEVKAPAIVIGALANRMGAAPDIEDDPSKEAFRLKIEKNMALIGGASDFGVSHGIYAMLEQLGCAWVMPGPAGEIIPKMATISLPDMDIQEAPCFGYRRFPYDERPTEEQWHDLIVWLLRHKANFPLGKRRHGFAAGGHAWQTIISRNRKEFEENPEMLGLVRNPDGSMERRGNQLETTHPRVMELAIEYIRQTFKANEWPNDAEVCVGMGPSDGGALSLSPETAAVGVPRIDYVYGQPDGTDVVVHFLNTILEKTTEEFPNLHLGFLLYSWHADYPMRYKPHPRIVTSIADITYSRFHSALDETSKSRAYYRDILQQWGRLAKEQGNHVGASSYDWNLADSVMPYTKAKYYGDEFAFRKDAGISSLGWLVAPDDWYLTAHHAYVGIKMSWNTGLDWKEIMREYCEKAFGAQSAPFMEAYYLELARRQHENSHETGCYYSFPLLYDKEFVVEQNRNFDAALNAAENEMQKKRIQWSRYPLKMLDHYLDMRNAYVEFDFPEALAHFEKAAASLDEISEQDVMFGNRRGKRYFSGFGGFLEQAVQYSSGEYRFEYQIPDRLKTAIDVHSLGAHNRFWGSKIDDSNYLTTQTFKSTWDAQGLSGFQQGSVWYRIHFPLAAGSIGEGGYGLFVGGADNNVAVWCNDQFIARTRAGARRPSVFDITDAVRPGEDNLIVIQVIRHGVWELFTGGIMMPSFVFSGPRVEQPEDTEPPFRMLPGGEVEYVR